MRRVFYVFVLLWSLGLYSQISVSKRNYGRLEEVDKKTFEKFKKTTTIFVLSNAFSKEEYYKILKEVWNVTPYKIVDAKDFDYADYLSTDYSFAYFYSKYNVTPNGKYLLNQIRISILDLEKINKIISSKKNKKIDEIAIVNSEIIGSLRLIPSAKFVKCVDKISGLHNNYENIYYAMNKFNYNSNENCLDLVYNHKETFLNFDLGYLKNYLQKMNQLLVTQNSYWLYANDKITVEANNLKKSVLYIPDYLKNNYDPIVVEDKPFSDEDLKSIFSEYKYKFQFISSSDLNNKILNDEEVYYLRFVREDAEKFFQIVNSKTGEIVLRYYKPGGIFNYNIKDNDLKEIYKMISKK